MKKFGCIMFLIAFFLGGTISAYAEKDELPVFTEVETMVETPSCLIAIAKTTEGEKIIIVIIRGRDAKNLAKVIDGDMLYSEEDGLMVFLDSREEI